MRSKTREIKIIDPHIIFEDKELLVLDKPSGWVVNDASSTKAPTIQTWLNTNFRFPVFEIPEMRNGIVHRIDKETSGLLLVAKDSHTFLALQKQFKERMVKKTYIALLHGKLEPMGGEIIASVGRLPWNRERFGVLADGREAETKYEVKSYYKQDKELYSFVEFRPKTGRTHQIRIHAKYLGHAIVSDTFYAGRKTARKDRTWCPRLFLHASRISFQHPESGETLSFQSPLPKDLRKALSSLSG